MPTSLVALTLFQRPSVQSYDIASFPKWINTLSHYRQQQAQAVAPANAGERCYGTACLTQRWKALGYNASQLNQHASLAYINQSLNQVRYIRDIVNWGVDDYWATPIDFLVRNGDCEDYAIAKYMMLRESGWSVSQMYIVILQDASLNALHSVLAVQLNGQYYILDNQIQQLRTDQQIYHYQPIYAINEQGWWRFL